MDQPSRDTVLDPGWLTQFQAEHGASAFADMLTRAAERYGGAVTAIAATLLTPPYTRRLMELVGVDVGRTLANRLLGSSWSPLPEGPLRDPPGANRLWVTDKIDELAARRGEAPPPDLPLPDLRQLSLRDPIDSAWLAHSDGIWGCDVSPDGRNVVSASRDRTLAVWDVAAGTLVSRVSTDHGEVRDCLFTPDGTRIVSVHGDGWVAVWTKNPMEQVCAVDTTVPSGGSHRWRRVAVSPGGSLLAIAGWNGDVDIWWLDALERAATFHVEFERDLLGAALSPEECVVVSRGSTAAITVWNVAEQQLTAHHRIEMPGYLLTAIALANERLLVASTAHQTFVWEFGNPEAIARGEDGIAGRGLAVSSNGSMVALSNSSGRVTIRTLPSLKEISSWYLPDLGCADLSCAIAFTPDNSRLVVAGWEGVIRRLLLPST